MAASSASPHARSASFNDFGNVPVAGPGGALVPLVQLAEITLETGPAQISREAVRRRIVVELPDGVLLPCFPRGKRSDERRGEDHVAEEARLDDEGADHCGSE